MTTSISTSSAVSLSSVSIFTSFSPSCSPSSGRKSLSSRTHSSCPKISVGCELTAPDKFIPDRSFKPFKPDNSNNARPCTSASSLPRPIQRFISATNVRSMVNLPYFQTAGALARSRRSSNQITTSRAPRTVHASTIISYIPNNALDAIPHDSASVNAISKSRATLDCANAASASLSNFSSSSIVDCASPLTNRIGATCAA
mmetsp:Transcript_7837/g.26299  ORF Transcript_7837/g.26299 Transcript_7837/m.26299 type:complete len:201 (+) Transcript_7837:1903-2505(+)